MDPGLDKFFSVLGVLICIVGSVGNLSVLLAFLVQRRLRTKVNGFLVSLVVSGLLLTGISMPFEVELHIRSEFIHGLVTCELMYATHFIALTSSSLNLLVISIYRYLTIAYPFFLNRVSQKHIALTITVVWLYSGITGFLPLMGWRSVPTSISGNFCNFSFEVEYLLFVMSVNWLLPAMLVFVFYGLIFRIARIQAIKILEHQVLGEYERVRSPLIKGAKTLAKIAAVYIICWFPYVINVMITKSLGRYLLPYEVHYTFVFLCYASAAINPVLYAWFRNDFREAFSTSTARACSWPREVFQSLVYSFRRITASLYGGGRESSWQNKEGGYRSHRRRSASGSSSVAYQPQTAATVVWSQFSQWKSIETLVKTKIERIEPNMSENQKLTKMTRVCLKTNIRKLMLETLYKKERNDRKRENVLFFYPCLLCCGCAFEWRKKIKKHIYHNRILVRREEITTFPHTKLYTQSKSDVQRNMSFFKVNGPKCQFFLRGDFYLHFLLQKELTR